MKRLHLLCSVFIIYILFIGVSACNKPSQMGGGVYNKGENKKWISTRKGDSVVISWQGDQLQTHTSFSKKDLPVSRIVICNPSAIPFISILDERDKIVGIRGVETVYDPAIHEKVKEGKIRHLGTYNNSEIESIIKLKPDLVIVSATNDHRSRYGALEKIGIKTLFFNDYEEADPLTRSAYLYIFGLMLGKEQMADNLYKKIRDNYLYIKTLAKKPHYKPSVFVNTLYGDIWYMPGKPTLQCQYLQDAGANYLWSHEKKMINALSFETVLEKAEKADYWVNVSDFSSLSSLAKKDHRYTWYSAYRNKKVYAFSAKKDISGNNDIYETGIVRCDWVLADLVSIFHPDLLPSHALYFYKKLL